MSHKDLADLPDPFLMEIWNAFSIAGCLGGRSDSGHHAPSTEQLWDELLSNGTLVWGVASDDVHEYEALDDHDAPTPGKAWIVAQADTLRPESIKNALRNGDFYASTGITIERYTVGPDTIDITLAPVPGWRGAKFASPDQVRHPVHRTKR